MIASFGLTFETDRSQQQQQKFDYYSILFQTSFANQSSLQKNSVNEFNKINISNDPLTKFFFFFFIIFCLHYF